MAYVIAIDIGGTFTDLVACDVETGAVAYTKSPTTYDRLGEAIFDCIRKAALDAREASFVKHGTTLVINALLQRVGAKTALLATKGFRDLLEIGRGNRTRPFDLRFHREPPLDPARAALRGDRADRRVRPGADAARHRRARNAGRHDAGSGRRGARDQLPQLIPDAGPRAGRGGGNAPVAAGCLRHNRHGTHARMARVRAHRDGGGQRLCRAAGQQIHRGIRFRAAAAAASPDRCC